MTLPKLEDWKAPWEADGEEFDNDKARKFVHGLLTDKARLQAQVTTVTGERDTAVKERDAATQAADGNETLRKEIDRLRPFEGQALRYEVALESGLTAVQAKRLLGSTKEELATDAKELLESFGGKGQAPEGEEKEPEGERRQPRNLRNPTVPESTETPIDITKALESIPRINS